jgi:26S proteasome regulatory subunit N12
VIPSKNIFVFPESDNPDIAAYGQDVAGSNDQTSTLKEKGVIKGVPMSTMVGPSLRLAHQLEAII